MSVRRRAVADRVERDAKWRRGFSETSAALDEIRAVIDSFEAEGIKTVTQEEFAVRLQALRDVSAPGESK
jgi:hypothetical protein